MRKVKFAKGEKKSKKNHRFYKGGNCKRSNISWDTVDGRNMHQVTAADAWTKL